MTDVLDVLTTLGVLQFIALAALVYIAARVWRSFRR